MSVCAVTLSLLSALPVVGNRFIETAPQLWHRVIRVNLQSWYSENYHRLTGHGLWLRGGELNTLDAGEFERRPFRVLFSRLSTYFDTADSFTHLYLYQLASSLPEVFPDLAYLPPRTDLKVFESAQVPWLLGTGSKRGAPDFDWIGISNSIVQELINLPIVLKKSGIPLRKRERLNRPEIPLILLGGANALYSSVLWNPDPWVDAVFVGESDEAIRQLLEIGRDAKRAGASKGDLLSELEKVDGLIQPDRPRKTRKAIVSSLNTNQAYTRGPVPFVEEQLGSGQVQISEGCPCFCTFCAESWDRKPYRERSAAGVLSSALEAKIHRGLEEADLYSFNFNMHSGLYRILWELVPRFRSIGMKSQRFDLLAHDPVMAEVQHAVEKASFTCGLEGISPRLRSYLQKTLSDAELDRSLASIFKSRCREIKVFLIATGREEDEDYRAFEELLERIKKIRQGAHSTARIIFSMTPLVRFPWTPLEFEDALPEGAIAPILSKTAMLVRKAGFEFREAADLPEYWVSQVLVRATDPRVAVALENATGEPEALYYRSVGETFRKKFELRLREQGLDPAMLLRAPAGEARPWEAVSTGVSREFLASEWEKARHFEESDYCLGRSWVQARCRHCGGCPTRFHVRDIVLADQERPYGVEKFRDRVKTSRESERELLLAVQVGPRSRGHSRKMLGVAVARALMLSRPEWADHYRGFAGSLWGEGVSEAWWEGLEILRLRWIGALDLDRGLEQANAALGDWGRILGLQTNQAVRDGTLLTIQSAYPQKIAAYLKQKDLKHTLLKTTDGYRFALAPQGLKKGLLRSLEFKTRDGEGILTGVCGPKFAPADIVELCRQAFGFPSPEDWVRLRVFLSRDLP